MSIRITTHTDFKDFLIWKTSVSHRETIGFSQGNHRFLIGKTTANSLQAQHTAWSGLKNAVIMLLLLILGSAGAWGQDLSGYYYLAFPGKVNTPSLGYNPSTPANNYYLCPTEDYLYYKATNQCTTEDNGQPFMTTYICRNGVYDADKAVWQLIKHTLNGQDYYYVKHVIDNKYLVFNGKVAGNRLRAHLESTTSPGTNALYKLTEDDTYPGYFYFAPYGESAYWLNLTEGNYLSLKGESGKTDGPTVNGVKQLVNGTLGGWTEANNTSQIYLEAVPVNPPTITVNTDGSVSISEVSGATIYYTTDDSDPKTSGTKITYSSTISTSDIASATGSAIKVVAVDNTDPSKMSMVVTHGLATYKYHIVNQSNKVALTRSVKQAVGTPLNGFSSIPISIRSSYISDETVEFRALDTDYNIDATVPQSALDATDALLATTETGTNIYITYLLNNLSSKYLPLAGASPLNLKYEEASVYNYLYDNEGVLAYDPSTNASITTANHLWYISSTTTADPYDVIVMNSSKAKYLAYSSSTLSLSNTPATYYIINHSIGADTDSDGEPDYEDITLKDLSSSETFTVRANKVKIPTSYYLIDMSGKRFLGPKESTSNVLGIPSEWESPVVTYSYFKESAFNISGDTYTLKKKGDKEGERTDADSISSLTDLSSGQHVYITYKVKPTFIIRTTESDLGNSGYMLHFSDGETFNQEDGSDGVMTEKKKAEYPYSNGDACLYVYDWNRWDSQLSSGASTRSRWLWHTV